MKFRPRTVTTMIDLKLEVDQVVSKLQALKVVIQQLEQPQHTQLLLSHQTRLQVVVIIIHHKQRMISQQHLPAQLATLHNDHQLDHSVHHKLVAQLDNLTQVHKDQQVDQLIQALKPHLPEPHTLQLVKLNHSDQLDLVLLNVHPQLHNQVVLPHHNKDQPLQHLVQEI